LVFTTKTLSQIFVLGEQSAGFASENGRNCGAADEAERGQGHMAVRGKTSLRVG
jgi:hypothetical protein